MAKETPQALLLQAMRRRTKLSFGGRGAYAVESLESGQFSMREIRQEYSRLRDIMRKRLTRLEASEEWAHGELKNTPVSLRMENYPTLREMRSERDIIEKLRDIAQAVESPLSTITGLEEVRSQSLKTLYEHFPEAEGVVTEENFREFGEFMEFVHTVTKNRGFYNNEEMIALFGHHIKKGTKFESLKRSFYRWIEKQEKQVSQIPEVKR